MIENPRFVFQAVAMMLLASFAMFILGLSMVRWLVKVLQIPRERLMPIIFALCVIGSYAIESRLFDVKIMVVFGLIGFLMKEMRYPIAPLVLGMILGDLLDKNLRRALVVSDGNILETFSRPISATILGFTLLMIVSRTQWFQTLWAHLNRTVFSRTAVTDRKG